MRMGTVIGLIIVWVLFSLFENNWYAILVFFGLCFVWAGGSSITGLLRIFK